MHAGVADDAEKMQIRPIFQGIGRRRRSARRCRKTSPLRIALVMRDRFLIDDPPGADVLVPDLAVAHRPLGQADVEPAGVDQHVRILGHQPVGDRMLGEIDGVGVVPLRIRILSPAVADDQNVGRLATFTADGMVPFGRGRPLILWTDYPDGKAGSREQGVGCRGCSGQSGVALPTPDALPPTLLHHRPHPHQLRIKLAHRLGNDVGFADDVHEVDVAGPAGDDVLVEVPGDAGAGAAAEVDADVEPLGGDGPLEQADGLGRSGASGRAARRSVSSSSSGLVGAGGDQQVAVGVGEAVDAGRPSGRSARAPAAARRSSSVSALAASHRKHPSPPGLSSERM